MRVVHVIDTGVANIRSLEAAFRRLDCDWHLTRDPNQVAAAEYCVLPGVGHFRAGAAMLDQCQLRQPLAERIAADRPTLAVCLGFQLLFEGSAEDANTPGLGILPGRIGRFSDKVPVPQLGWNEVVPRSQGPLTRGDAYFANSFRLADPPPGWGHALTEYDGMFVSAVWQGRVLACQFHPELSGPWGGNVLRHWLEGTPAAIDKTPGATPC